MGKEEKHFIIRKIHKSKLDIALPRCFLITFVLFGDDIILDLSTIIDIINVASNATFYMSGQHFFNQVVLKIYS